MTGNKITRILLGSSSILVLLLTAGMVYSLINGAIPVFNEYGLKFITSAEWNPTEGSEYYGALSFIIGTLITSGLALVICLPLAFSASLFIGEYFRRSGISHVVGTLINLLAGVPSIVYGLWGFYVLRPLVVDLGLSSQGFGIFTAGLILAIMIIPYATSISTEVISMVPNELKEAAYSLGATRFEVIANVIVPNARSGIFASYILAFGRALGETMAVTMLVGNSNAIPGGLFDTGNTMASVIANQFGEAEGLKLSALIGIGLILFFITALINAIGKIIIKSFS